MEQWGQGVGGGLVILVGFSPISPSGREYLKKYRRKEEPKKKRTTRVRNAPPRVYYFYSPSLPSLKKIPPFYEKKNTLSDTPPEQARPVFALFLVIDVVFFVWY